MKGAAGIRFGGDGMACKDSVPIRMRPFLRPLLVIALATFLLPGCSLLDKFHRKRRATVTPKHEQLIGTVVLINTDIAFALIDNGSQPSPSVGATLQCRSADGSTAQLKVTAVRRRPFIVADIVSGTPGKGDEVFQ